MKYTHRTRDGRKARIVCYDVEGAEFPVLALVLLEKGTEKVEHFYSYTSELYFHESKAADSLDLFEISPWDDVAVDTPIWVRRFESESWRPRHFAKYEGGVVYSFQDGRTSHSKESSILCDWPFVTLENPNGN